MGALRVLTADKAEPALIRRIAKDDAEVFDEALLLAKARLEHSVALKRFQLFEVLQREDVDATSSRDDKNGRLDLEEDDWVGKLEPSKDF